MRNRQLKKLLICLIVVISLLVNPVMVFAASSVVTVSADKTEAEPGDVITFSVILGPVDEMGTMQMQLVIPDGLSYVEGSGKLADGLRGTLGFDVANFMESSKFINGYASSKDYSSDTETLLCTFQCKVEEDYTGIAEVSLANFEFYSCETWEDHTDEFSAGKAVVTVSSEPISGGNEDPGQQTDPTPSGDPTPDEPAPSGDPTPDEPSPSGDTTPDDPASSGNTTPDEPAPSGDTTPGEPAPSGSTTPNEPSSSGSTTPDEPSQSGSTTPGEPEPSGDSTPDETEPSGDTTPDNTESSENTSPNENSPTGNDTPSGNNNTDQDSSGGGKQSSPDSNPSDTNKVPRDSEGSPKTDYDSQNSDMSTESGFLWWAVLAAIVFVIAVLLIILKKRKDKKRVVDTLNKEI